MSGVVVHPGVLLGAAAAIALLSFGLSSWLYSTGSEIKHLHKRIDRLVRKLGISTKSDKQDKLPYPPRSLSSSSPLSAWVSALRGDVEFLKEKNRFVEQEMQLLRVRLEFWVDKQVPALLSPSSRVVSLHSLSHNTFPTNTPTNLPPPPPPVPIPAHLSHEEWVKAAEELVWCTEDERKERREEIEEAMGNTPEVLDIIRELFDKSAEAMGADEKRALAQEFGDRLYSSLVGVTL